MYTTIKQFASKIQVRETDVIEKSYQTVFRRMKPGSVDGDTPLIPEQMQALAKQFMQPSNTAQVTEASPAVKHPATELMPDQLASVPATRKVDDNTAAWRKEWENSAELQKEFCTAESYVAWKQIESRSTKSVLAKVATKYYVSDKELEKTARAEWNRDPAIQAEFKQFTTYVGFRKLENAKIKPSHFNGGS